MGAAFGGRMTQQAILTWIEQLPTRQQIEREAGLPQGYLSKCKHGKKNMRPKTLAKVLKVVKKHGFRARAKKVLE